MEDLAIKILESLLLTALTIILLKLIWYVIWL